MATDTLDVKGLPEDKVSYLQQLIEQWKQGEIQSEDERFTGDEDVVFVPHKSKVIGHLTRNEIYDHL